MHAPHAQHAPHALRVTLLALAGLTLLLCAGAFAFRHYADPIARRRILRSVDERLHTHARLDDVHVTFRPGLRVVGSGLHVPAEGTQPGMDVRSFQFATGLFSFFRPRTTLVDVEVQGLRIVIPPDEDHAAPAPPPTTHTHGEHGRFLLARVVATDAELDLENADPAKFPLQFHIARMVFDDPRDSGPVHFDAILSNPGPIGDVHAHGLLGPCSPQRPRETPVSGRFDFSEANLASMNGVRGHLHGAGTLAGTLGMLVVEGDAATPDFNLAPGALSTLLTSHYHATADTLTGEFTLAPVTAHLLHTDVTATGRITRVPAGHDIALDTELHGRAEDLLDLLSPTRQPPLFRAAIALRGPLHIPPGRERMLSKLGSSGQATLTNLRWSDAEIQSRIDSLSLRAQDRAREAKAGDAPIAPSSLTDAFQLHSGRLTLTAIDYRLPGATVRMDGAYDLPTETLDFHGIVRTDAAASHMTTGLKSLLLKPLDPFLRKRGAGMQLPVSLIGPKRDMKLSLDLNHRAADDKLAPARGR